MARSAAGETIARLRASGISQADISKATGISPRMLRFVEGGKKPGTSYAAALSELESRGRVSTPPPVRPQRVRAAGGQTAPAPVARPIPTTPRRGAFGTQTTYVSGGRGRMVDVTMPASDGPGRDQARATILDELRRAAQGRRRVSFIVSTNQGRQVRLGAKGGYRATDAYRRARQTVRRGTIDPLQWIADELDKIDAYADAGTILRVVVVVF